MTKRHDKNEGFIANFPGLASPKMRQVGAPRITPRIVFCLDSLFPQGIVYIYRVISFDSGGTGEVS